MFKKLLTIFLLLVVFGIYTNVQTQAITVVPVSGTFPAGSTQTIQLSTLIPTVATNNEGLQVRFTINNAVFITGSYDPPSSPSLIATAACDGSLFLTATQLCIDFSKTGGAAFVSDEDLGSFDILLTSSAGATITIDAVSGQLDEIDNNGYQMVGGSFIEQEGPVVGGNISTTTSVIAEYQTQSVTTTPTQTPTNTPTPTGQLGLQTPTPVITGLPATGIEISGLNANLIIAFTAFLLAAWAIQLRYRHA